jgi:hypothetical protein
VSSFRCSKGSFRLALPATLEVQTYLRAPMRSRAEGTHKTRPHVAETLPSTVHDPYTFIGTQGTRLDSIYSVHCATDFRW